MSWDGYIDNLLGRAAGNLDRASIIGLNGGGKWTTNKEVQLKPEEAAVIAQAFNAKKFDGFQANGIQIEGQKYQFLREEDKKIVFAKKKDFGSVTMQSSKQAIIIGHTPEGKAQGTAAVAVSAIADYLESLGY